MFLMPWRSRSAKQSRPARKRAHRPRRQWSFEQLEDRRLLTAITKIQDIGTNEQFLLGATALSIPITAAVGAGHSIVVEFASDVTLGAVSVSDSAGNIYAKDADVSSTVVGLRTVIFASNGIRALAPGDSITVAFPATTVAKAVSATEFAGLSATSPLDATQVAANLLPDTSPSSGLTAATTQANELVLGAIGVQGLPTQTFTPGAGFTGLPRAGTGDLLGNNITINPEYKIVSATGQYQADATLGTLAQWAAAVATYRADAATHFSVSAPANASAGTSFSVTVTALDASNQVDGGYTGTVRFASSDGLAALPSNYTFTAADHGSHTFTVTLDTAGGQTVTATDTLDGSVAGTSGSITTVAGVATHFSVSAPANAAAGAPIDVTVTAQDAFGNAVADYNGTVRLTSSDGAAVLPGSATLVGGVGTFVVTLDTAGSQTVTATDTVNGSLQGTSGAISVSADAATHFSVSAPANATAGTPLTVTVTAKDAYGNTATDYAGAVHLTSSDGSAVLPASATLTAGVGSFNVTLYTAGNQTLSATDATTGALTGTSGNVSTTASTATHFVVSAPANVTTSEPFNVTVTAKDAYGNTATGYSGLVQITSSDLAALLPANATLANGIGAFAVTLATAGNQTVTATDTLNGAINGTSATINASTAAATHFRVAAPANATAGTPIDVTVTALDASNNIVVGYTRTVHLTSSDGAAVLPGDATLTDGIATFAVTLRTAGNQTVSAADAGTGTVTGTSGVINTSAAVATRFNLNIPANATAGAPFRVSVTALDSFGNTAVNYNGSTHVSSLDSAALLPSYVTFNGGIGAFTVTLATVGQQTIVVTDAIDHSVSATATLSVTSGGVSVTGFEESPLSGIVLARFVSGDGSQPASAFSALIDWGDGTQSVGSVSSSAGEYAVTGDHVYGDEGQFRITVSLANGGVAGRISSVATILETLLPDSTRGTADQRYISEIYHDLLGRQVDMAGLAHWIGLLSSGASRYVVVMGIEGAQEYLDNEVQSLYEHYLRRSADTSGLNYGVNFLRSGGTSEQLAAMLLASTEYARINSIRTNDDFLNHLFLDVLNRAVDPPGRAFFDQELQSGASRSYVADQVLHSGEYQNDLVVGYYRDLLDRVPDFSGLEVWTTQLAHGATDQQVIAGIIAEPINQEYYRKTAP